MKTSNFRKAIIPSFALLIGGSFAATMTSTLAWFQYATKAQLAYVGSLTHCSKLLKISVDNGTTWGNEYSPTQMANKIAGNHLLPITTGALAKNEALPDSFYAQPDLSLGDYSHWQPADATNYARFTIKVKVSDVDGASTETRLENDVYITKLLIEDDSTNGTGSDLSDAVRVHLAVTDATNTTRYFLFAKSVTETAVGGKLDLNGDGEYDKELDSWGTVDCIYGENGGKQYSYLSTDPSVVVEDPDNPVSASPVSIGKTGANNMTIVVTTWIEGWSLLDHGLGGNANGDIDSPIWDPAQYINKKFNVGLRLGVKSHNSDHQN